MRIRNAIIATAIAATALGAAAHADAQIGARDISRLVNGGLETANCDVLGGILRTSGVVSPTTTRGELVNTLNSRIGTDPTFRLLTTSTVNTVADRAVSCNIVKPDPVTPQSQAIAIASQLSAQAGLPEIRNLLPVIAR